MRSIGGRHIHTGIERQAAAIQANRACNGNVDRHRQVRGSTDLAQGIARDGVGKAVARGDRCRCECAAHWLNGHSARACEATARGRHVVLEHQATCYIGRTRISLQAREREGVATELAQCARARDGVAHALSARVAERQGCVVHHRTCAKAARGAAAANLQGACVHGGGGIGVGPRQDQGAIADLGQVAAADGARPRHAAACGGVECRGTHQAQAAVGAGGCGEDWVEIQSGVVHHQLRGLLTGGRCAQVAIAADGQAAGVYIGGAGVGVGSAERQSARPLLLDHTAARNHVGYTDGIAALEHQGGVVDDVAAA